MFRHYIYLHRRNDTGEVFYVGKGTLRSRHRTQVYERAYSKERKNPHWINIVNKHGYTVEIFASCVSDDYAQQLEMEMIAQYGRYNLGKGPLVNLTDGGEGHTGIIVSDDLRQRRSENSKGKRSEAWVASIRRARKNGGNGGVVKKGDKLPESWRASISKGQKGPNNYMRGRRGAMSPVSRKVVDTKTGVIYDSVLIASEANNCKMKTLYNWLSGHRPNPTTLEFA